MCNTTRLGGISQHCQSRLFVKGQVQTVQGQRELDASDNETSTVRISRCRWIQVVVVVVVVVIVLNMVFLFLSLSFCLSRSLLLSTGKDRGLEVSQVFPEEGNLGLVLPTHLCKWTTEKVKQEGVRVFPKMLVSKVELTEGGRVRAQFADGTEVRDLGACCNDSASCLNFVLWAWLDGGRSRGGGGGS